MISLIRLIMAPPSVFGLSGLLFLPLALFSVFLTAVNDGDACRTT
jgi:hypothetical protein